jgi:PAS domain S-box-containing protein
MTDSAMPGAQGSIAQWTSVAEVTACLNLMPDAVLVVDRAGQIVFSNGPADEMFGFAPGELTGQSVDILLPARFRDRHVHHRAAYAESPRVRAMGVGLELAGLHRDGHEFPVEISLSPVQTSGGLQVVSVIRDLTERKRLDRELQARAHLLDLTNDAILVRDPVIGLITYWNRGAEVLYGWSKAEALGQISHALLQTRFPVPRETIEAILLKSGRWEGELLQTTRDGRSVVVASAWTVEPDPQGRPIGFLEVNRDITQRKQAEEQLQRRTEELARSNTELQQFAYVASHDLQEPLRMVASYTQLLARRYRGKLDQDADEFIAFAVDGATRMQLLINDLLAYSRVGTRGRPFAPTDCNQVVDQVIADLGPAIHDAQATVTRTDLPTVVADRLQLSQVFQNLVGNALKYRGTAPPEVTVSAQREDGIWVFAVQDNGIGIDPPYFERIFVLFQRLHSRAQYPGTGIGLAICKKIVERHGGHIWVESQPGQGATFFFTIPDRPPP